MVKYISTSGGGEAVSAAFAGNRLYLWDDGQLCKASVSGIKGNFIRNGIFSDPGE